MNYYVNSLPNSSSTGNELLQGVNPLAGIVHGRSILAQTVQKVVDRQLEVSGRGEVGRQGTGAGPQGQPAVARRRLLTVAGPLPRRQRPSRPPDQRQDDFLMSDSTDWRVADSRIGILFIVPFALAALVFMVYPVVEAVRLAFYEHDPLRPEASHSSDWKTSGRSSRTRCSGNRSGKRRSGRPVRSCCRPLSALRSPCCCTCRCAGISIFRGLLLFPYIVPTVVIALVMQWMLNPEIGMVNYVPAKRGHDRREHLLALHARHGHGVDDPAERLEVHAFRDDLRAGAAADVFRWSSMMLRRSTGRDSCADSSTSRCRNSPRCWPSW